MSKATITLIDTDNGGLEIEFSCKKTEENSRAINISRDIMKILLNSVEGAKEESTVKTQRENQRIYNDFWSSVLDMASEIKTHSKPACKFTKY